MYTTVPYYHVDNFHDASSRHSKWFDFPSQFYWVGFYKHNKSSAYQNIFYTRTLPWVLFCLSHDTQSLAYILDTGCIWNEKVHHFRLGRHPENYTINLLSLINSLLFKLPSNLLCRWLVYHICHIYHPLLYDVFLNDIVTM